nr:NAD(P)H-hydrate dehydratase [Leptolyngbya sp. 'hensonii']
MSKISLHNQVVVTAAQMRAIEERVFAAGIPVAALMEKVGGLISRWVQTHYPPEQCPQVGILAGPGHNGGDALVVARELHFRGYRVVVYQPFSKMKDLTHHHARYAHSLGLTFHDSIEALQFSDLILDGLFGFGLERELTDPVKGAIDSLNQWSQPVVSIDLPSGLQTDTGARLGTAVRATWTLCLGLWKQSLLQEQALEFVGQAELIDFDLPIADIQAVLGEEPAVQRITAEQALAYLPLSRPPSTHKYQMGHVLLICGSLPYAGAAILCGLGARATGVGMLSIAVPESLKPMVLAQLPEALVIGCPETAAGGISRLPAEVQLDRYDVVACGPGLSLEADRLVQQVLESDRPLVLDADGLNLLAQHNVVGTLKNRQAPTVLTPHLGEFRRLFPKIAETMVCRITAVRSVAEATGTIVLLKGARIVIGNAQGRIWINPDSTPALARGGTGDVLTGLIGGLMAQGGKSRDGMAALVQSAAWWHAQAGILAARERTELGVDAFTLSQSLIPAIADVLRLG